MSRPLNYDAADHTSPSDNDLVNAQLKYKRLPWLIDLLSEIQYLRDEISTLSRVTAEAELSDDTDDDSRVKYLEEILTELGVDYAK